MMTTAEDSEMIVRQVSWLQVYCRELNMLEQPDMPQQEHQAIMVLRGVTPHFFSLVSALLKDALILGLDNLLDLPKSGGRAQLTIEHVVRGLTDADTKKDCEAQLTVIRKSACYHEVKKVRNNLIAHANRATLRRHNAMSVAGDFPNLTIPRLEEMLYRVSALAGQALGKLPSEFVFLDWDGVSQLFKVLQQKGA